MTVYDRFLDKVRYSDDLDGGGRLVAPIFERMLRGRKFKRCLEWGCGPAWIGLWLMENGICEELVASDINPKAIEMVALSAASTGLPVKGVVSDNFENVEGKFDLVVVSPPKYCNIQKNHKMGHLREDLRPSDVNWCIHREFYANIASHLTADAELWIAEVEPFSQEVELLGEIYDKRPNVPIIDFVNMMTDGGVRLEAIIPFPMGHLMMTLFKVRLI